MMHTNSGQKSPIPTNAKEGKKCQNISKKPSKITQKGIRSTTNKENTIRFSMKKRRKKNKTIVSLKLNENGNSIKNQIKVKEIKKLFVYISYLGVPFVIVLPFYNYCPKDELHTFQSIYVCIYK